MSTALAADSHAFETEEDLQEAYHDRGWTDGLPIVAPTPERVEACLAALRPACLGASPRSGRGARRVVEAGRGTIRVGAEG